MRLGRLLALAPMDLRTRILDAAAKLYAEAGFRGATTRRIAERAGVNEITVFRHFGSKTRLLHEAVKGAGLMPNLSTLPVRSLDPRAELREWAITTHRALFERRSLIRTAMGELEERPDLLPPDQSPTMCAGQMLHEYLIRLRDAGRISGELDLQAATTMLMGTLFADAMSRDVLPAMYQRPAETSIDHYVALFVRALDLKE